jgi:DNA-binding NarL/FixJ family response regulator
MSDLRIVIADDHEVLREGARALIEREEGWKVCGMAGDGRAAVALVKELKPDVVILDMTMPELSGLEALRQIKRASPQTEVLVFSATAAEDVVSQVFDAGAKSYIRKADASRHLVAAITSLAIHKPFFTPEIADILFAKFRSVDPNRKSAVPNGKLTAREREIARLVAEGKSNKETATMLGISVRTTETHRAALMRKLGLDSLADLVRYAIRNQFVEA